MHFAFVVQVLGGTPGGSPPAGAPRRPLEMGLQLETPVLAAAEGASLDQGRLPGAAADARCARGVPAAGRGARPGRGREAPRADVAPGSPRPGSGGSSLPACSPISSLSFWRCPLPSHGVICLLSLHFQAPLGHPLSTAVTHFVPSAPSLSTSPRVAFSQDSAHEDAADPAARVCSPARPRGAPAPSPGAREASFRPVPAPVTRRGGGHGRGGGGRGGPAPEPPPLLPSSRGLCLSPQVRRLAGGGGEGGEAEEEGVGGGSPLK